MKSIGLGDAIKYLKEADYIITADGDLVAAIVFELSDCDPEDRFAHFTWFGDGNKFSANFLVEDNTHVAVHDDQMTLVEEDGDDMIVFLARKMPLEN